MAEWPRRYHPARYFNTTRVVDTSQTAAGYQLQPRTWEACAAWCGGVLDVDADGNQSIRLPSGATARLGDYVMSVDGVLTVDSGDGHYQRWASADHEIPG
jgi:hypothetical protein